MEIKRCYDTIIGASVGENQLVQSGATSVTVQSGHKYYAKINGAESLGTSTGSAITINDSANDMVIDLTQMLGSAIADYVYSLGSNGIAKLREWGFLKGYQAYNSGSIESVEVTGKKVVGFNQWDEVWELGGINSSTGENTQSSISIRSKNYIPIVPDTTYYNYFGDTSGGVNFQCRFYDSDKNYIGYVQKNGSAISKNRIFETPETAHYLRFQVQYDYGTTYKHDICINLSSDRNGEYEPYTEQSYDYGTDTLNGIFKLDANNNLYADGDVKTSDGMITRKYVYALLNDPDRWINYSGSVATYQYTRQYTDRKFGSRVIGMCSCFDEYSSSSPLCIAWLNANNSTFVGIIDTNNTLSLDALKAMASAGRIAIVYELQTPTTEQSTPFPSPQVCYPDGTEEYETSNGVPVGHETRYEL